MRLLFAALISLATASVVELFASRAEAEEYTIGAIQIAHPTATPPPRGQTMTAAYMTLNNSGDAPDRLLSASSRAARAVEIHETRAMGGGMMGMQAVANGVVVPPHGAATFAPGGLHLMVIGLSEALHEGDVLPLTLRFEHAGSIEIAAAVERPGAAEMHHSGHTH